MKWRKLLHKLHRDVGYLCAGLVIVYAVSGVAVNHREHWDYNFSTDVDTRQVGAPAQLLGVAAEGEPGKLARERQPALVERLTAALKHDDKPRKVFWRGPDRLSLFFGEGDGDIVDYMPSTGSIEHTVTKERPLFRQFNLLHLNEPRSIWTYVADAFAVLLFFLAISGAVMTKGRNGLRGRGGILVAIGVVIPVLALLFL